MVERGVSNSKLQAHYFFSTYSAHILSVASGTFKSSPADGLTDRPTSRVHVWHNYTPTKPCPSEKRLQLADRDTRERFPRRLPQCISSSYDEFGFISISVVGLEITHHISNPATSSSSSSVECTKTAHGTETVRYLLQGITSHIKVSK